MDEYAVVQPVALSDLRVAQMSRLPGTKNHIAREKSFIRNFLRVTKLTFNSIE